MKQRWFFPIVYISLLGILGLHALSPAGFVTRNLPISIESFAFIAVVLSTVASRFAPPNETFMQLLRKYITPLAAFATPLLLCIESLTYSNFIYSKIHIDPLACMLISFFVLATYFTTITRNAFKKRFAISIMFFGILVMHVVFLKWYNYSFYNSLSGEDKVFEWFQFAFWMLGAGVLGYATNRLLHLKKKTLFVWLVTLYVVLGALGYFAIAGEEISWGQRILGFDTPKEYIEYNSQGEFNLHNNEEIFDKIYMIYGSISVYVILSSVLYMAFKKRISKNLAPWFRLLTFRWYHTVYFIPTLVYISYRLYYQTSYYDIWEESSEVLFALGMVLYAVHAWHVLKKETMA